MLAAIELGGTKTLVTAAPQASGQPARVVRLATRDPASTLAAAVEAVRTLADGSAVTGVGVASFGPLALDPAAAGYGRLLATPKAGWAGADVRAPFREAFGAPVAVETDVNAAALAEGRFGAAAGVRQHAYVTVGTGVGVGVVVEGRPVHGAGHPEGGHVPVRTRPGDTFAGVCAWHGRCVEGLVSGPALHARLGRDASDVAVDDPVWDLAGEYLAQLLAALTLLVAPQRIVVGGGVGARPELRAAARAHLGRGLNGYVAWLADDPALEAYIAPARLSAAGLTGALMLAQAEASEPSG